MHLLFPERTTPLGSQIMDKGEHLFINVFNVKNVKEIMELKHAHTCIYIYIILGKRMLNVSLFLHPHTYTCMLNALIYISR